jgi:peptidoglycan hydrolase-like protein with peptidoglycan-binding domain
MRKLAFAATAATFMALAAGTASAAEDVLLYRYPGEPVRTGRYGPVARLQARLFAKIDECGAHSTGPYGEADGVFGGNTRRAVQDVLQCYPFGPVLGSGSSAEGAITTGLWDLLMNGEPAPTAAERANQLTLVLEATDYDALEYNFCQSKNPSTGKRYLDGDPECYSNDRASYITWGPRGATAGHGAEVQQILYRVDQSDPSILGAAFGAEAGTMRRLIVAKPVSMERILCAVWLKPARRAAVKAGFARFGALPKVQNAYREIYDSADADGAKMARFYALYKSLEPDIGRAPTEIDFAFFLDRATHGGVPDRNLPPLTASLKAFIAASASPPSPAQLRWKLASLLPVANQKQDRLGRDVIFVIDDPKVALSAAERAAWTARTVLRASDFGLSDAKSLPNYEPGPSYGYDDLTRVENATAAEMSGCPAKVLAPKTP